MKTKQLKEEPEKGIDEETVIEPKTRARKKASDVDDDKKSNQEDPKPSKEVKKLVTKPKAVVKKRPLGIRKTLRGKKPGTVAKDKVKTVIRQAVKRGRKPGKKLEATNTQDKETVPLIPASEIKKEPTDDSPNSRSSSPKTAGRRQRLSSDMIMMKTMLGDSPNNLVLGPRTSPYSMRSERSNSPSMFEGKKLRSGKPRKIKNNLLSEVVLKEQKKRRRLYSDSKTSLDTSETAEDCKKFKRGRSCSRDGSEISKCSDNTESDLSMSETLTDADNSRELNKKLDKSKTDLDIDIESNVQISTIEKVPSLNVDSKPAEAEPSSVVSPKDKKKLSLQRSTSLDSDNNNSNRLKIEKLNSTEIENKISKTDNSLLEARSSILTSMSKTFNSLEVTKNIRKARRGRKAAVTPRPAPSVAPSTAAVEVPPVATVEASLVAPVTTETCTITAEPIDDKIETIDTLTKEINDLINDLDQNINSDHQMATESIPTDSTPDQMQTKTVSKFYGLAKPVNNENEVPTAATPVKSKDMLTFVSNENTPSKSDDGENIRLHYEEDSVDKPAESTKPDIPFKVASIDKLMDRLKEFEEFDKRRQMESKTTDTKPMMVTNDVVLIPKFGEVKPLKDIQSVRSPEKPIEKENVFSSLENNAAISIVKRDHVRKSIDIDLPNSVTLIKRNSFSSRKESTSSNHSRESDAISLFEKSLGKDVTLTELRKSVDKSAPSTQVDLHQFATLHPNGSSTLGLDSSQISITPRVVDSKINNEVQIISKRKSRGSMSSRKSSESLTESEEKMATIEKIKSPIHHSSAISITAASAGKLEAALPAKSPDPVAMKSPEPVVIKSPEFPPVAIKSPTATPIAMKSPESTPIETEALPPPEESIKPAQSEPSEVSNAESALKTEVVKDQTAETPVEVSKEAVSIPDIVKMDTEIPETAEKAEEPTIKEPKTEDIKPEEKKPVTRAKPSKSPKLKSARNSTEQPGPSNMILETPESQKRKENVLRTLGLLTHKAANEAKIEKLKEKERIYGSNLAMMKSKGAKSSGDYTGTLKTVIKLNRGGDKKRHKSSLKMTFQKTKYRGKPAMELGEAAAEDDAYYTIERREGAAAISDGGHRKSHYSNRLNSHDTETAPEPVEPKETLNLVIPEKASSFSIHPGRLCMDQCFYCGGKFGLFDTPCHIAQIKSSDRQKKILDNEEKLTIDSCLCDACYRHVDRRANCPSYRKRPPGKQPQDILTNISPPPIIQSDKPPSPMEEDSEEAPQPIAGRVAVCHTKDCTAPAVNSIRRKVLIKLRSSVNKLLKLKGDYPGLHTIPLCGAHYAVLEPLLACALCRRRLAHQHVHVLRGYIEINPLLKAANIPVEFTERPVICKNCQYYCTLLQRPGANNVYCSGYRRRLLLTYNVELPAPTELETEDQSDDSKSKKKRPKSKQRKSTDPTDKTEAEISESSERTSESTPEKEKIEDSEEQNRIEPLEEDIESLISSNKILVPNAKSNETPSDGSEADQLGDMEQLLPIDKQTELQYLLQKQNNPAQFLQKQRNLLKIQNVGIQKPGLQQRIQDKNAKRIHKLGQLIVHKDKMRNECYEEPVKDGIPILKNISLNDECTIETITNKKPADIATLKNKWVTSESFTQVKKNLSELSKSGKKPEGKYSNPVKRLETNPSISVRELFPGEEEMNLQCNIEFNNVKGVTPEGWEKCNTLIQYDVETKKLWNELQRPYGNQSSFLRHLIILEKYFRSGELVLSHNATPHAANYSDSVQSRLRAYDNIVNDTPRRSEPAISLIEFRKKPSMNGKSLLKSNQSEEKKMPPPKVKSAKVDKAKSKALPPELIAINTPNAQGRKAIQNVLHNIQQLVKGVSASDPTEIASAPLPPPLPPPLPKLEVPKEKKEPQKEKKDTPKKEEGSKKTKTSSKPWRPTLMPITQENLVRIAREPVQVAVDGRNLPSLVQVMSSGKRYHITLQDYNKMCIMRREKLQQLQDGDKPKRHSIDDTTVVTEIQPSAMLGNGGTVLQNIITEEKSQDKKDMPELTQIGSNAANILKNVGLKNITIAPITPKTATMTSQSVTSPIITSPSLIMTSTPLKIPQLGPAVSIMSETILSPSMITSHMIMPKIPKSLTVIPQTVVPISSPTPTEVPRP